MAMGNLPAREWMIKDAKGRKYSFDSETEAFGELAEYGEGATVWTRDVVRVAFITKSVYGWQEVSELGAPVTGRVLGQPDAATGRG
ncbi:hypothetical protein [Actinacidiphila rubida]|uniref:Uncharacterized protein n=1 Tax=Actinacidiphila rubida TaxID=310780 RepID=A0A1H8FFJ3_9ACTN|nr:hypothetical protein [Actinacidiphila rubida]SEN30631.1 hypothetical protein SAMN05216267_1003299 [Actinacidiphila rubida]